MRGRLGRLTSCVAAAPLETARGQTMSGHGREIQRRTAGDHSERDVTTKMLRRSQRAISDYAEYRPAVTDVVAGAGDCRCGQNPAADPCQRTHRRGWRLAQRWNYLAQR